MRPACEKSVNASPPFDASWSCSQAEGMKRYLSAVCLLVLLPTVILLPYAFVIVFASLTRIGILLHSPTLLAANYPAYFSPGEIAYLELLGFGWLVGYFATGIAFLLLLLPLPRMARFVAWTIPVIYYLVMLYTTPWSEPVWGGTFESDLGNWAMRTIMIVLPVCLLGLWFERPGRQRQAPALLA
jgi:hypothetical protein